MVHGVSSFAGDSSVSFFFLAQVAEEGELEPSARTVARVGKMDAKKHLDARLNELMSANIMQCMATMLDTLVF